MTNVRPLRTKDIIPAVVIDSLNAANERGDIDHIYVIAIKDGKTTAYASGDLNQIGLALVAMHDLVGQYTRGEIDAERL